MIRKIQIKFILLSMSVLLAVLILVIGGINIANYSSIVKDADGILSLLSENQGRFPKGNAPMRRGEKELSPELPYESRFFSVLLSNTGEALQTETRNIAAIDEKTAVQMAQAVASKSLTSGFWDVYRYWCIPEGAGRRIIFLDCGKQIQAFQSFLIASIVISLAGFLLVWIVVTILSGKIIRPFAESYEKQTRFVTDAGHELKTPLTIINADVDILEMEYGESEWLADIQKHVKRLASLTNDLVMLARMEETERSVPWIDFPVSDVIGETASSFHALAQTKGIGLAIDVQPMLSMQGDEKAIGQLIRILLDNALKYTPSGGTVSVSLEKRGRQLKLCVYNTTNCPLPADNLNLLFERFYRADPSRNSQTGGYGIGLSVAKAIVSSHGGKIQASTEDGQSLLISVFFQCS